MSERSELMPAPASASESDGDGVRGRSPRGAMKPAVDRAVLAVLLAAASGLALWNAFEHGLVLEGTAAGAVIGFAAGWEVARQWWRGVNPARSSVCSRPPAS